MGQENVMNDILAQIWNLVLPTLGAAVFAAALAILTWASHAVRSSDWYARQPIWHRKLIDIFAVWVLGFISKKLVWSKDIEIALQAPVKNLMPAAEKLRDPAGEIHPLDADMLTQAAIDGAKENLLDSNFGKAIRIPAAQLNAQIAEQVKKVVKKENAKRRKANPNKPGGAGAHP
jgi:hypothetical protein